MTTDQLLITEYDELATKCENLEKELETSEEMTDYERDIASDQYDAMVEYLACLKLRISLRKVN